MKTKLALVALLATLCTVSQAASVDWKSAALDFGGTALKNNTDVKGWVVYLASGSFADSYKIDDSFSAESVGVVVASDTDGTNKGSALAGTALGWTNDSYKSNGDTFGLVLSYNDGEKTYWNISSVVNSFSGLVADDPTVAPADWNAFTASGSKNSTSSLSTSSGWTAVPEPSTAALALAGLALLLKRRKA